MSFSLSPCLFVPLSLVALFAPALAALVTAWGENPDYSHGPLIPLVAGWLAWRERGRWAELPRTAPALGFLLLVAGLSFYLAALWADVRFIQPVALILSLAGVAGYLLGGAALRALAFPLAYLLLMVPWPDAVVEQISFPLQLMTSRYAAMLAGLLGLPVRIDGVNLYLPDRDVSITVAAACSGMRSLVALLALAALVAYLTQTGPARRWSLFALSVPLALGANVIRVLGIMLVGQQWGQGAALWFHDHSGVLVFLLAAGGLVAVGGRRLDLTPLAPLPCFVLPHRCRLRRQSAVGTPAHREGGNTTCVRSTCPPFPRREGGWGVRLTHRGGWGVRSTHLALPLAAIILTLVAARLIVDEPYAATPHFGALVVPATLGSWRAVQERSLDAESRRLLAPEVFLWRVYREGKGSEVDLFVVRGRRKQSFHSPGFCLPGGGFQVLAKRSVAFDAPGAVGRVPATAMLVEREGRRLLVCHWYSLDGQLSPGLIQHAGRFLWRRLRHRTAEGAFVRLIAPASHGTDAALATISRFVAAASPSLITHSPGGA